MLTFVDANVFVRLFVEDDTKQTEQASMLFERAQNGEIDLVTGPPVFFEVGWVLRYSYKVAQEKILDVLEAILSFPALRVLDKDLVISALFLARKTSSEFADAYIAASAQEAKADNVGTFNKKHFTKLGAELYSFEREK